MSLRVHILPALKDNYIYALVNENGGECAVVDPGDAAIVNAFLAKTGCHLKHILCTHHHWDHTDGAKTLADRHHAPIWCSESDVARISGANRPVQEGVHYDLLGEKMEILAIPGHTLGQIGFWFPDMKALFAGDTLFSCGCGRLFEGTHEQMFTSLQKIKRLPPETKLYFGHEYTVRNADFILSLEPENSAVREHRERAQEQVSRGEPTSPGRLDVELNVNPFLSAPTVDEFRRWREARNTY